MVIVYQSNTGFTEEYAGMLARAEGKKVCELSRAAETLEAGTEVFYMGPLMAGHIAGVDRAVKQFAVKGVCGVGMSPPGQEVLATLAKANYVPNAPIFYLHGGWAPDKVGAVKRRMVNLVTSGRRKALRAKADRTPYEQALLDMMEKGGSFVAFQNLETIRKWMKEQK